MNTNKELSKADQAFEIFKEEAKRQGRNYVGDMVKDNLKTLVGQGYTPKDAVSALFNQADRGRRRY